MRCARSLSVASRALRSSSAVFEPRLELVDAPVDLLAPLPRSASCSSSSAMRACPSVMRLSRCASAASNSAMVVVVLLLDLVELLRVALLHAGLEIGVRLLERLHLAHVRIARALDLVGELLLQLLCACARARRRAHRPPRAAPTAAARRARAPPGSWSCSSRSPLAHVIAGQRLDLAAVLLAPSSPARACRRSSAASSSRLWLVVHAADLVLVRAARPPWCRAYSARAARRSRRRGADPSPSPPRRARA